MFVREELCMFVRMETFKQQFNQTAEEFKILLNHEPLSTPDERFLQLIIINIFAIYNTAKRGAGYYLQQQQLFHLFHFSLKEQFTKPPPYPTVCCN